MHIEVPGMPVEVLYRENTAPEETSAAVRRRVCAARERQLARTGKPNSLLTVPEVERWCRLDGEQHTLLERAVTRLGLSARALHRILRVALTIADHAGTESITTRHLTEAIGYRRLERGVVDQ